MKIGHGVVGGLGGTTISVNDRYERITVVRICHDYPDARLSLVSNNHKTSSLP